MTPGSIRVVENDDIPAFVAGRKVGLHQAGLQDVIACAKLLGDCAENMLLVGVQPVELEDPGGSLRPAVKAQIPVAEIAGIICRIWYRPQAHEQPSTSVITPGLELDRYEADRPDSAAPAARAMPGYCKGTSNNHVPRFAQVTASRRRGWPCARPAVNPALRRVNTALLDCTPVGDWLLAHVDIAIRALMLPRRA